MNNMTILNKPVIAVYPQHYLTISMTFVYRQLLGVSDEFSPIVLAKSLDNLSVFPFDSVYACEMKFSEKVLCWFIKKLTRKHSIISPFQIRHWTNIIKNNGVSLIHAHFGPAALEILPIAKALKLPLLVTFHGYDASSLLRNTIYIRSLCKLFEYAHVITVSKIMADKLSMLGAKTDKTYVHYIGVPVEDFQFISRKPLLKKLRDSEQIRFLQVSNFVEKKGHCYTVQAFRDFLAYNSNCLLTLAGDGPLQQEIIVLCDKIGIRDKVRFVGKVSKVQVIELMENSDVFLHHSVTAKNGDQEGIPTVLMEAMSSGLIVISTLHSGIPELIEDSRNGYLVNEKDIVGYVDKIIQAVNSPPELPQHATQTVHNKFNIYQQNAKLKDIYRTVICDY